MSAAIFLGGLWRYPYVLFPLLLWAAVRFTQLGAVTASFTVAAIGVAGVVSDNVPLGGRDDTVTVQILQGLLAVMAISLLALGASIAERDTAAASLRQAAVGLAEAQALAHIGSWEWDIAGDRVTWSNELYRIYDLQPERGELNYEAYLSRIHPDDRDRVRGTIEAALAERRAFEMTHRIVLEDGSERIVQGRGRVILDRAGHPVRMVGTSQDVTERERVEQVRENILSAVSHELRTPLTAILGFAITLRERWPTLTDEGREEMIGLVASQAARLERLLNDLLDVDRLRHGRLRAESEHADLGELVRGVVAGRPEGRTIDVQAESVYASVDPAKFERIVDNLIANAERHTPAGSPIEVSVAPNGTGALLRVDDRGPGVPDAEKETIFEAFTRGSEVEATGVGVGLSLVAQFAALHGGRAWVEDNPGGGASFRVLFPDTPLERAPLPRLGAGRRAPLPPQQSRSGGRGGRRRARRLRRPRQGGALQGGARRDRLRSRGLGPDETLIVQSGKAVAVLPTHEDAPRVLISTAMIVPEWSDQDTFRRLEDAGLTMYGQMTAAGWFYIGTQGILGFTYETFRAVAAKHFGGSLAGRRVLTAGLGGMGGAQGFGVTLNGGRALIVEVDPARAERRLADGWVDLVADYDDALAAHLDPDGPAAVALVGNAADVVPRLLADGVEFDVVTDQTAAHDPLRGYVPRGFTRGGGAPGRHRGPGLPAGGLRLARRPRRGAARLRERGAVVFEYGNGIRAQAAAQGLAEAMEIPGFVAEYVRPILARGVGPFRWICLTGDPEDLRRSEDVLMDVVGTDSLRGWIELARERVPLQGLPARICWLGLGERDRVALALNELVRSGECGPLALGRDHMDPASVASPTRETEGMLDGSDAIADWPVLSALLNAAQGASWVAIGNGGGVGVGRSIHSGMVVVADGSELAERKIRRVFWTDPALGVARYADAGYPEALAEAERHGL